MDVLKPELIWVEDRCYRFPDNNVWLTKQINAPYEEDYDQMEDNINQEVNNSDCNIVIKTLKNGRFQHDATIPPVFYRFLIGFSGSTKKNLESETKTTIKIPSIGSKENNIVIVGKSRSSVISCRQRIDLIVEFSRKKLSFTHFVSIPLDYEVIINNFIKFKNEILNDSELKLSGLSEECFVSPYKLHLTIGMLLLVDDKEKNDAIGTLDACVKNVIKPILKEKGPINIKIQGLEIMNDDPEKVKILYGKVLKNDTLQEIANKTQNFFVEKGLMKIQYTETVNLHMTLINTSIAIDKSKKNSKAPTFDATKILKKYKDYYFGDSKMEKINISIRKVISEDGSYEKLTEFNLST